MIEQSVGIGVSRNQHHHKGTLKPHLWIEVSDETPIQSTPDDNHHLICLENKQYSATCTIKTKTQTEMTGGARARAASIAEEEKPLIYEHNEQARGALLNPNPVHYSSGPARKHPTSHK